MDQDIEKTKITIAKAARIRVSCAPSRPGTKLAPDDVVVRAIMADGTEIELDGVEGVLFGADIDTGVSLTLSFNEFELDVQGDSNAMAPPTADACGPL